MENPLLAPSGHSSRKTFLVLDEGYLGNFEGFWVEDEEDGAEGFLALDEDTFWVFDDDSAARLQRRFQGRNMRHMAEEQSDAWQAWDWQEQGWDEDWSWQESEESCAVKGKVKKGKKIKGKGKWSKDGKGDGEDHFFNAASESSTAQTFRAKPISALLQSSLRLRRRKKLVMFPKFSPNRFSRRPLRMRCLISHMP